MTWICPRQYLLPEKVCLEYSVSTHIDMDIQVLRCRVAHVAQAALVVISPAQSITSASLACAESKKAQFGMAEEMRECRPWHTNDHFIARVQSRSFFWQGFASIEKLTHCNSLSMTDSGALLLCIWCVRCELASIEVSLISEFVGISRQTQRKSPCIPIASTYAHEASAACVSVHRQFPDNYLRVRVVLAQRAHREGLSAILIIVTPSTRSQK